MQSVASRLASPSRRKNLESRARSKNLCSDPCVPNLRSASVLDQTDHQSPAAVFSYAALVLESLSRFGGGNRVRVYY